MMGRYACALRPPSTARIFGVDGNMIGMVSDKATISADVVFRRG
jgi:hypothetical protein